LAIKILPRISFSVTSISVVRCHSSKWLVGSSSTSNRATSFFIWQWPYSFFRDFTKIKRAAGRSRYSNPTTHSTIATSASLALDLEFPRPGCSSFSASTLIQSENFALGMVPSAAKQETRNCPGCCLRDLLRLFLAVQLQTALSHTAAALHAAMRCKQAAPRAAKITRARQQHRPRQRAESSHAATPRTEELIAHSSSTARGNALNRTQPRAQKKTRAAGAHTAARPRTISCLNTMNDTLNHPGRLPKLL
jgi:hypothetical protein